MSFVPAGLTPLIGVFDMPSSLAFYRDLLGFEIVDASPEVENREGRFSHWMWLRHGPVEIMLNTQFDSNERPVERDPAQVAAHRDTVFYVCCADVDATYAELSRRGLNADPPHTAPYGLKLFSARDPDGYVVVFQQARSAR
ncbi:hypothetical protein BH09PSE4_BH09PSE4_01810 [soil metagenome]